MAGFEELTLINNFIYAQANSQLILFRQYCPQIATIDPNNTGAAYDNQMVDVFQLNGNTLELSLQDDGQITQMIDLSSINSDDQLLSLGSNTLSIQNGNSISLTPYLDSKWTSSANDIYNINSGNVGIGTTNPTKAKLEVEGTGAGFMTSGYAFVDYDDNNQVGIFSEFGATTRNYSIYASGQILATEFNAFSDARIKNIKGISDGESDLSTLMQIEVTDYQMKDTIENGNDIIKKVIAQQIAEVYPQAVDKQLTDVIPDIYQRANVENGWIQLETNLQVGERIKIITKTSNAIHEVTTVENGRFQVAQLKTSNTQAETIFIYGREVKDFHTVDYEALSMLHVSATQAQQRRIEALEVEVVRLKKLEKRLAQIEARLQTNRSAASVE